MNEIGNLEKGVHVRINNDISKTIGAFKANNEMEEMMGEIYMIEEVRTTFDKPSLIINGYSWCPDDVTEMCPEKEPQPFLFNIEELENYEKRT